MFCMCSSLCITFVSVCRLSRRLGDKKQVVRFSNKILDSLLTNMSHLRDAHSSGSLQAYFLILGRVKSLNSGKVALKVI